jgi:hypothetical protein
MMGHMQDAIPHLQYHAQRLEADAELALAKAAGRTDTVAYRVAEELRRISSGYRQIIATYPTRAG